MKIIHNRTVLSGILLSIVFLLTVLTVGCGKNDIKKNKVEDPEVSTTAFANDFFYNCNLPSQIVHLNDVQNTPDEYLFYIEDGVVYRTLNDYVIVIVERNKIRESEEQKSSNYSGALYQLFEDDEIDILKYSASGEYALMAIPSTIPDWENDEVIIAFMSYSASYQNR